MLDERNLGYADFRGNKQYFSTGNHRQKDRVALFSLDYPNRRRLKLMARAEVFDAAARGLGAALDGEAPPSPSLNYS